MITLLIATGTGVAWIGPALIVRWLEQRRIERTAARRPIGNRYADHGRVWR